jgi:hypothetical protein
MNKISTPQKIAFATSSKPHFRPLLKAEKDLAVSGYPLKHRFLVIAQVTFFANLKVETQIVGPDDPFNISFSTSTKSHSGTSRKAKIFS